MFQIVIITRHHNKQGKIRIDFNSYQNNANNKKREKLLANKLKNYNI